jgi:hypothetical protein
MGPVGHETEQKLLKSDQCGISAERRLRFKKKMEEEHLRHAGLTQQEDHKTAIL